jgi:hypothetical protein
LLAGGGACLGLTELFFREKLKVPVEFFQPFRRAALGAGVVPAELAKTFPSWAILVGAALRSLPDSPCRINILGSVQKAAVAKTKDRPAIIAVGVGVGLLLLLPGLHGFWQSGRIQGLLSPQTAEVEEAEAALGKVDAEQKKGVEILGLADKALGLEAERMRWPILLAELRAKSLPGMWVTQIALAGGEAVSEGEAGLGAKPGAPKIAVPVLELGGFFETKSEEADSKVVEDFRLALEQGGVLQKVETTQRDTPERSADGKTEQVALQFRMRAEWPVGGVIKVEAAKKPEAK